MLIFIKVHNIPNIANLALKITFLFSKFVKLWLFSIMCKGLALSWTYTKGAATVKMAHLDTGVA